MLDAATKDRLWTQGRMVLCMQGARPEQFSDYKRFLFEALKVRDARTGPAGTAMANYRLSAEVRHYALLRLVDKKEESGLSRKAMLALLRDVLNVGGT